MNIAYVSNVVYPFVTGGAQKRIHEIGTRLATDHEVTIYGRHFWDGPHEIDYQQLRLRGISPPHDLYIGDRRSITEALEFAKDLLVPLRRHIDEHDVVVASIFPYFPVLASELCSLLKHTPIVTTWHEVWGRYWNEYLGSLAPFGKATERLTAMLPQNPIAVSSVTAERLARISTSQRSITIVPNGINTELIQSVPPADDGFDILFAGRLIPDKNTDLILSAFDRVTDRDITLGLIGDGPEFKRLQRRAETMDSSDRIEFLGFLDTYEDVISHMRAADIFLSPSIREGFGITLLEAMAAGCTVIAADAPRSAATEIVEGGGFLVDPTEDAISAVLRRVLCGEQPQQDPRTIAKRYDWDIIANQAIEAYRNALKGVSDI